MSKLKEEHYSTKWCPFVRFIFASEFGWTGSNLAFTSSRNEIITAETSRTAATKMTKCIGPKCAVWAGGERGHCGLMR